MNDPCYFFILQNSLSLT